MKNKTLFVVIFFLITGLLKAQNEENIYKYWMTLGCGFQNKYIAINFNYSFSLGDNYYKVGFFERGEFNPFGDGLSPGEDGYLIHSVDISIGKRFQSKWFEASFWGGPSYLFGEKKITADNYEHLIWAV